MKTYRRLLHYLAPHRGLFIAAFVCMVVFGASDGVVPFLVKHVLDGVFARRDEQLLYVLPLLVVLFALIRAACDFGQQYLMCRVGHHIVQDMRNQVHAQVLRLEPGFFVRKPSADILTIVNNDIVLIRSLLTDSLASIVRDTIRIVALVGAAFYLDPVLAIIGVVVLPVGIVPVYRFGRRIRRLSRKGQDAIGTLSGRLQESILGSRVVKIFLREQHEQKRFESENSELTATFVRTERTRALTGPVNEVLASIAVAGVMLYGGFSVISQTRTQGDFIAFLIALFLMYDPFKKLGRLHSSMQQGIAAADRLFELLDTSPRIGEPAATAAPPAHFDISFDRVTVRYSESGPDVLKDVTFKVAEGQRVALVGFSGAGKSTLVDLLPRFIDPRSGVVRIGGIDVKQMRLQDLRGMLSLVGQHTFLFNDTVFNNIAYGLAGASREQVEAAARAAYAYEFISQLPQGFDTVVGEGGFSLSGGERQRIAIARAILKDAPILLLDEATASLDNRAEREVQMALEQLAVKRTSIIIAHRLSTVRSCHQIVVLHEGQVIETGTNDELLRKGGEYSKLYALQFQDQPPQKELHESAELTTA